MFIDITMQDNTIFFFLSLQSRLRTLNMNILKCVYV